MSTYTLTPSPYQTVLDENGVPLIGAKIYTYVSATSTPQATYADATGSSTNSNPILTDSSGRYTAYLLAAAYKFIITESDGTPLATIDPVSSVQTNLPTGVGEIFVFGGSPDTPIVATSYPSGTGFDKCHAGTAFYSLDTLNLTAGVYKLEAMMLCSNVAVTVTAAIVNLTDGSPDTPIGTISSGSVTGERQVSSSLTLAAGGAAKTYAIKTKVSSASSGLFGFVWGAKLIRTS
jgi:hypothetical protein